MKRLIRKIYFYWKTRHSFNYLNNLSLKYPIKSGELKNVLIILPRQMEYIDPAIVFVRRFKQHFRHWQYMILDIDKVLSDKLNFLDLPNENFIKKLSVANFDLAVDLNQEFDLRIGYLVTLLKIPYRVHLMNNDGKYYNIMVKSRSTTYQNYDFVLKYLKTIFITEESSKTEF